MKPKSRLITLLFNVANHPKKLAVIFVGEIAVAGGIYSLLEKDHGFFDGIWWAFVTASTVGYGDQYPETLIGRLLAVVLMLTMVFLIIPIITAQFASELIVDRDKFSHEEQEALKESLNEVTNLLKASLEAEQLDNETLVQIQKSLAVIAKNEVAETVQ